MADKLLVIISTAEPEKARTGMMYAVNALKHCWMEEVRIFFFSPTQELLTRDPDLQHMLAEYQSYDQTAIACKFLADRDHTAEPASALGVEVAYVGTLISELIREGYVPMVW
jgi:hypothetical protein